jgi:hypothetical protein
MHNKSGLTYTFEVKVDLTGIGFFISKYYIVNRTGLEQNRSN